MAGEDGIPPWVEYLTGEMNRRFDALDGILRSLVTRDAFRDEQTRVNTELRRQDREISDLKADLKAESTARASEQLTAANQAKAEAQERQKVQRATNWQWFLVVAGPLATLLLTWVANGGLARP